MTGTAVLSGDLRAAYWESLEEGDAARAVGLAHQLQADGVPLADILETLVCGAQAEVGRRWAAAEWNVAQEHRATSVSEDVVSALSATIRRTGEVGSAIVSCVDGEWHALPARVVAAVLREAGWQVHFLGASVPTEHLAQLIHDLGPDFTALSCMLPTGLFRARDMIEASRDLSVPVLVGGAGFGPGGRWGLALGANGTAGNPRGAVATVEGQHWPRFTGPAPMAPEPDDTSRLLRRQRPRLVSEGMGRLGARWPAMADYDDRQLARTEEDLAYLVDFLAAACFVDDAELYADFVAWMRHILEARHVPVQALLAGLAVTREAIEEVVGPRPRVERIIAAAGDGLTRSPDPLA